MKPFMRAQLERSVQRLSELDFLLSREDIMKDMTQFMALSREHAEVMALVTPYQKWQHLVQDLAAAQTMLQEADPELQAMAQEEIASAEPAILAIESQLQRMLLPKDPDDARNSFLEIRAGTGGDESALFAGICCACTPVIAPTKVGVWKSSANPSVNWVATKRW